jgi:toxin HigB-1
VIESFKCKETERIWNGHRSSNLPDNIQNKALRKLRQLDAAQTLADLRNPPGNKLEKLKGDRKEQHSIRIDRQWRICFIWNNGKANDVEIVDYH